MADTERKSMDDVLASIRRIVRAEKEGAMATESAEGPGQMSSGRTDAEPPMVLTPEMRTDLDAEGGGAAGRHAAGPSGAASAIAADREALRGMLRDLLHDELSGGAADAAVRGIIRDELTSGEVGNNISQNVLRAIRAEVAKALQAPG